MCALRVCAVEISWNNDVSEVFLCFGRCWFLDDNVFCVCARGCICKHSVWMFICCLLLYTNQPIVAPHYSTWNGDDDEDSIANIPIEFWNFLPHKPQCWQVPTMFIVWSKWIISIPIFVSVCCGTSVAAKTVLIEYNVQVCARNVKIKTNYEHLWLIYHVAMIKWYQRNENASQFTDTIPSNPVIWFQFLVKITRIPQFSIHTSNICSKLLIRQQIHISRPHFLLCLRRVHLILCLIFRAVRLFPTLKCSSTAMTGLIWSCFFDNVIWLMNERNS